MKIGPDAKGIAARDFAHSLTTPLDKGLRATSVRGGAFTFFSQSAKFVIQLGTQITLTRLLLPADFGLLAMVAPIIAFATLFNDLGLSQATIQKQTITQLELSSLFWLNVTLSIAVSAVLFLASPLVGWFYSNGQTSQLTACMAIVVAFGGGSAQHLALLNRKMSFGRLSVIDVSSILIGGVAAVAAAFLGLGFWSLAVLPIGTALTTLVLAWSLSGWRPSAVPRLKGVGEMLWFGVNVSGFNIVNFFARSLDNILIGRFYGAVPLGFYDRAYKIMLLPLQQISGPVSKVAIPLLSRLRETPDRYRDTYLQMLQGVHLIAIPGVICAVALPNELVTTLFGQQWAPVGPIVFWLSLVGTASFLGNSTGWLFISQGRSQEYFFWGAVNSSIYCLAFFIGLRGGALGVARAYALSGIFLTVPLAVYGATRKGSVRLPDVLGAVWPFFTAGLFSFVAIAAVHSLWPSRGIERLAEAVAVSYATSFALVLITPTGRTFYHQLSSIFSGRLKRSV